MPRAELVVGTGHGSQPVTPFFQNSQGRGGNCRKLVVVILGPGQQVVAKFAENAGKDKGSDLSLALLF